MKTKTVLSCLTERDPPRVSSALSIQIAPCIREFKTVLDSGFQSLKVCGTWILDFNRYMWDPEFTGLYFGFHK